MSTTAQPAYPLTLEVDYPDRPLNRTTNAFRIVMLVPIAIVLAALTALGRPPRMVTRPASLRSAACCSFPRC